MIIRLTEFDNAPILINTNAILYARPKSSENNIDAKSYILLVADSTDERDNTIFVKESLDEIMQVMKDRQNSLF